MVDLTFLAPLPPCLVFYFDTPPPSCRRLPNPCRLRSLSSTLSFPCPFTPLVVCWLGAGSSLSVDPLG